MNYAPSRPFEYSFLDQELRKLYDLEIAWREEIMINTSSKKCQDLNNQTAQQVIKVESIMRKEIQK